jgi:hypothetical protein
MPPPSPPSPKSPPSSSRSSSPAPPSSGSPDQPPPSYSPPSPVVTRTLHETSASLLLPPSAAAPARLRVTRSTLVHSPPATLLAPSLSLLGGADSVACPLGPATLLFFRRPPPSPACFHLVVSPAELGFGFRPFLSQDAGQYDMCVARELPGTSTWVPFEGIACRPPA